MVQEETTHDEENLQPCEMNFYLARNKVTRHASQVTGVCDPKLESQWLVTHHILILNPFILALSLFYVDFSSLPFAPFIFLRDSEVPLEVGKSLQACMSLSKHFFFRFGSSSFILISFLVLPLQYHHECQYTPFLKPVLKLQCSRHYRRPLLLPSLQSWRMLSLSAYDRLMVYRKDWLSVLLMKLVSAR